MSTISTFRHVISLTNHNYPSSILHTYSLICSILSLNRKSEGKVMDSLSTPSCAGERGGRTGNSKLNVPVAKSILPQPVSLWFASVEAFSERLLIASIQIRYPQVTGFVPVTASLSCSFCVECPPNILMYPVFEGRCRCCSPLYREPTWGISPPPAQMLISPSAYPSWIQCHLVVWYAPVISSFSGYLYGQLHHFVPSQQIPRVRRQANQFWDQLSEIYPNTLFASFNFESVSRKSTLRDIPSLTKITNKNHFSKTRIWIQLNERSILTGIKLCQFWGTSK